MSMLTPTSGPRPIQGEIVYDDPAPPRAPTPATAQMLEHLSYIMDRLVPIPGTKMRVGLNALFFLLPVFGDIIPTLISLGILTIGLTSYRVPRIVATRMVMNSLLDASIGWIPFVGDVFDMFFKADTRNVRLLQRYSGQTTQTRDQLWKHWVYVLGIGALFVGFVVLLVLAAASIVHWFMHLFSGAA